MESLKDWAMTIAGIVIFAGLLEMLVPAGGMKRYVQLAMGLLILLTLLQPVISVLQHTRDLAWETEAAWQSPNLALSSVMAQADRIRADSSERQVMLYRTRLEEAAASKAAAVLGGRPVLARVTLGKPPAEGGPPPIESVVLEVGPGGKSPGNVAAANGGSPGTTEPTLIEPVQPVEIQLGGAPHAVGAPPAAGTGAAGLDPAAARATQRAVAALLEVAEDRVTVRSKS